MTHARIIFKNLLALKWPHANSLPLMSGPTDKLKKIPLSDRIRPKAHMILEEVSRATGYSRGEFISDCIECYGEEVTLRAIAARALPAQFRDDLLRLLGEARGNNRSPIKKTLKA
jgi:hypothetical protein